MLGVRCCPLRLGLSSTRTCQKKQFIRYLPRCLSSACFFCCGLGSLAAMGHLFCTTDNLARGALPRKPAATTRQAATTRLAWDKTATQGQGVDKTLQTARYHLTVLVAAMVPVALTARERATRKALARPQALAQHLHQVAR